MLVVGARKLALRNISEQAWVLRDYKQITISVVHIVGTGRASLVQLCRCVRAWNRRSYGHTA
jgi:hypothetical protein